MRVNSLHPHSLDPFPVRAPALRRMFARGESRPEWCFLAWEGGRAVASLGLRCRVPGLPMLEIFALQAEKKALSALLAQALEAVQPLGAGDILVEVGFEKEAQSLVAAGFVHLQDRTVWGWESPWPPVHEPPGFMFRNMEQAGEDHFIDTLALLFETSDDPLFQRKRRFLGEKQAAETTLEDLKTRNAHGHWWQVCLDLDRKPAGLVCPYLDAPRVGTFGLLECFPGKMPDRLSEALLARGTAVLQSRGVDEIHFCASPGWQAAFERVGGYRRLGRRHVLSLVIPE